MSRNKYLEVEEKVECGFDRNVDYNEMKDRLIKKYKELQLELVEMDTLKDKRKKIVENQIIYCLVAMIQLKNGCRILEGCKAIKLFFEKEDLKNKILVKLAKSECTKKNKEGETFVTKARFRKVQFPFGWVDFEITEDFKKRLSNIEVINLKQRVLDYLLKYFDCNTHSLRYAFIGYMLYEKHVEMPLVSKFVGHKDVSMLVRYTQNKKADEIFDLN